MAVNKVVYGTTILVDLTDTTATADKILSGYGAYGADGVWMNGAATGGGGQALYCGTTSPSSNVGKNGDLYFLMNNGATVERYPESYTSSGMNSTSNLSACIGKSAEGGSSTSNVYSSGQSTTGRADYSFDLSDIPSGATITSVSCVVKAHEENASRSECTLQLYAGSTAKGSEATVNGTSNALYTLTCGTWTRSELDSLVLRMSVGYYGGLIAGATLTIEYETEAQYNASITGNAMGWTITSSQMYQKSSGAWSKVSTASLDDSIERK